MDIAKSQNELKRVPREEKRDRYKGKPGAKVGVSSTND